MANSTTVKSAPAVGCFGQLKATEAYCERAKAEASKTYAEWADLAERFYLVGYRDGKATVKELPQGA